MKILEDYEEFKKRNIETQKKNSKNKIESEKKKIAGLNKQKVDGKIKKLKNQKQELQKTISSNNVGGSDYYS